MGWAHHEYFNLFGAIIQFVCVLLLPRGITFGKTVINAFTLTKVLVVSLMICTALAHFNTNFLSPFYPAYHKFQPNPKEISDGLTTKMTGQTRHTLKTMPKAIIRLT